MVTGLGVISCCFASFYSSLKSNPSFALPSSAPSQFEIKIKQTGSCCFKPDDKVVIWFAALTCRSTQRAVVEEAIGGVVTATAHSSSSISVHVGFTLFLEVGSRGLKGERKGTWLGRNTSLLHLCPKKNIEKRESLGRFRCFFLVNP